MTPLIANLSSSKKKGPEVEAWLVTCSISQTSRP